jgi:hypothetical protein
MIMTIEAHVFGTIVLCMIIMYSRPERALVMDVTFVTTIGAIIDNVIITENVTVSISANMDPADHAVLAANSSLAVSGSASRSPTAIPMNMIFVINYITAVSNAISTLEESACLVAILRQSTLSFSEPSFYA